MNPINDVQSDDRGTIREADIGQEGGEYGLYEQSRKLENSFLNVITWQSPKQQTLTTTPLIKKKYILTFQ